MRPRRHHPSKSASPTTCQCQAFRIDPGSVFALHSISSKRLRSIEMLKSQGMSNRAIAHRLGVTEKAIRKLMGPSKPAESAQLALPAITTQAEKPAPSGVPSATPSGEDEDRAMESARKTVTAPEAVNDDEPLPMSLDRDASDRTLDRQLAYLPRQPPLCEDSARILA